MAVMQTIAIVGATENPGTEIANKLAQENYRLLLISNDEHQLTQLTKIINGNKPMAEIDALICVKDGCWEADIIILAVPSHEEKEVVEMIREVATQKIVVSVSRQERDTSLLRGLLPFSNVVKVFISSKPKEIYITGDDEEALQTISNIFKTAGYHLITTDNFSAIKTT